MFVTWHWWALRDVYRGWLPRLAVWMLPYTRVVLQIVSDLDADLWLRLWFLPLRDITDTGESTQHLNPNKQFTLAESWCRAPRAPSRIFWAVLPDYRKGFAGITPQRSGCGPRHAGIGCVQFLKTVFKAAVCADKGSGEIRWEWRRNKGQRLSRGARDEPVDSPLVPVFNADLCGVYLWRQPKSFRDRWTFAHYRKLAGWSSNNCFQKCHLPLHSKTNNMEVRKTTSNWNNDRFHIQLRALSLTANKHSLVETVTPVSCRCDFCLLELRWSWVLQFEFKD